MCHGVTPGLRRLSAIGRVGRIQALDRLAYARHDPRRSRFPRTAAERL